MKVIIAFSEIRKEAVYQALLRWIDPSGQNYGLVIRRKNIKMLGVSDRTLFQWITGDRTKRRSPTLGNLIKLWRLTQDRVFLLTKQEYESVEDRGHTLPDDYPANGGEPAEAPPGLKRDTKSPGGRSAYSQERLKEIAKAVTLWFDSLEPPKVQTAQKLLSVGQRNLYNWRSQRNGPNPESMHRMHKFSGDDRFLLLESEAAAFRRRNKEVSDAWVRSHDPPTREETVAEPKKTSQAVQEGEESDSAQAQMIPQIVNMALISYTSGLNSLEKTMTVLQFSTTKLPKTLRRKAAAVVVRIMQLFELTKEEFLEERIQRETDPEILKELEGALGIVRK